MIKTQHIVNMINHWLATPPNGYFAQGYGCNVKEQLLQNLSAFTADAFIAKMKQDIPVLQQLNDDQLSIVTNTVDFERVQVFIQLGTVFIEVKPAIDNYVNQDFYNPNAS